MGDMTKFNSAIEYYIFNVLLMCLLISEIFIFFYTRSKQNRTEKIDTRDLGTKWLLYLNFVFCLIISFLCISQKAPFCIRELTLPAYFAKIGMFTVLIGAVINIVLDPILIFTFDMGVKGAALTSIIAQGVSSLFALNFLFGKKSILKIRKKCIKQRKNTVRHI